MDSSLRDMEGEHRGEREANARSSRFILPEDGYEWKKYGQKFIKNISKNRNYFKCRRSDCFARKKADWSTLEPASIRVVYEGVHNHALPAAEFGSIQSRNPSLSANQYDLWTQVCGYGSESEAGPSAPATMTAGAYLALLFFLPPHAGFRVLPHEVPPCELPQAATMLPPCEFPQAATMLPACDFPQAATMLPPYEFPQAPFNQIFAEPVSPFLPQDDSAIDPMTALQTDHGLHADHALYSYIPCELHAWEANFPNMTLNGANAAAGDVAATSAAHSYSSAYGHFQHVPGSSTGKEE